MNTRRRVLFFSLLAVTLVSAEAFAAGGGAHHVPSIGDLFWPWFNFILYVSVIGFILKKPMAGLLVKRKETMEASIARSTEAFEKAEQAYRDVEEKLRGLESELVAMKERIVAEAKVESREILDSARSRAKQLRETAAQSADAEVAAFAASLQAEALEEIFTKAQAKLQQAHTENDDRAFRDKAVESFDSLKEQAGGVR